MKHFKKADVLSMIKVRKRQGNCNCRDCLLKRQREKSKNALLTFLKQNGIATLPERLNIWKDGWNRLALDELTYGNPEGVLRIALNYMVDVINTPKQGVPCGVCGFDCDGTRTVSVDGREMTACLSCSKRFKKCYDCKTSHFHDDMYYVDFGEGESLLCVDCYEKYGVCYKCQYTTKREDMIEFDLYNRDNYPEYEREDITRFLCPSCHKEHQRKCDDCGIDSYAFLLHRIGGLDNGRRENVCPRCKERRKPVNQHNYKPVAQLITKSIKPHPDKLLFGLELEVEQSNQSSIDRKHLAQELLSLYTRDMIYCKHDGSLKDRGAMGLEIVSNPFSWNVYKETKPKWDDMLAFIKKSKWTSYETGNAGMHVHMAKAAFTSFHLYKFMKFMYDEEHRPFFEMIAQRPPNEYCLFDERDRVNLPKVIKDKLNQDPNYNTARHGAVSLMYEPTVEVRIFRGSLNPMHFHKNIEFCKSVFEFALELPANKMNLSYYNEWLNDNRHSGVYRNLITFIEKGE